MNFHEASVGDVVSFVVGIVLCVALAIVVGGVSVAMNRAAADQVKRDDEEMAEILEKESQRDW